MPLTNLTKIIKFSRQNFSRWRGNVFWNFASGFLSLKEHPARMNFKCEETPQIMHFLFLPPRCIENTVHCSSGKFLPSTIRPLSPRLGKCFWHNQQQGECFNSSVNTATEVYCCQTDTRRKTLLLPQAHLPGLGPHRKSQIPTRMRNSPGSRAGTAEHRDWSLGFSVTEKWILSQNPWAVANCLIFWKPPVLSTLPST